MSVPPPTGRGRQRQASQALAKHRWRKRSAPRPRDVTAVPRGNDVPRTRQTVVSWHGARCPLQHAATGRQKRNGGQDGWLKPPHASHTPPTRLTTGAQAPWRAAGSSPRLSERLRSSGGGRMARESDPERGRARFAAAGNNNQITIAPKGPRPLECGRGIGYSVFHQRTSRRRQRRSRKGLL
jgi:hypothetical protein